MEKIKYWARCFKSATYLLRIRVNIFFTILYIYKPYIQQPCTPYFVILYFFTILCVNKLINKNISFNPYIVTTGLPQNMHDRTLHQSRLYQFVSVTASENMKILKSILNPLYFIFHAIIFCNCIFVRFNTLYYVTVERHFKMKIMKQMYYFRVCY